MLYDMIKAYDRLEASYVRCSEEYSAICSVTNDPARVSQMQSSLATGRAMLIELNNDILTHNITFGGGDA